MAGDHTKLGARFGQYFVGFHLTNINTEYKMSEAENKLNVRNISCLKYFKPLN